MCDEEWEGNGYTGTIRGTGVVCHCGCETTMKGADTEDEEELVLAVVVPAVDVEPILAATCGTTAFVSISWRILTKTTFP